VEQSGVLASTSLAVVASQAWALRGHGGIGRAAVAAALAGRVGKKLHASIREAKAYVEGRPVRVLVRTKADVQAVEDLVAVKLKPEAR
jgi:hypothetical protein